MKCPLCKKQGFRIKDLWSRQENNKLKCNKCGEWSFVWDWGK